MIKPNISIYFIFLWALFFLSSSAFAAVNISKARSWQSPDKTRVVLELSDSVSYRVFQLKKPHRVVIDLKNAKIKSAILNDLAGKGALKLARMAKKDKRDLQLIFDLKYPATPKSFLLKPSKGYGHRLVVDLTPVNKKQDKAKARQQHASIKTLAKRDLIVAIDAGHGGEDPGAIGRKGTKEKVVVLSIAKEVAKLVNRQKGMKAVMIRTGDYYVSLRERTRKARKANADVFISIHADAFRNNRASGSSVFILSKRGASSETARWLAAKENSSDLAGGVSLDDKDDLLAKVLLDLSQTATIEGSVSVAERILKGLKKIGKTHKRHVERAGFVVLKSPDIPSILVETGFISNYGEEKKLRTKSYQKKLAKAIFNGVNNYFKRYPIPGTVYGQHIAVTAPSKQNDKMLAGAKQANQPKNAAKSSSSSKTKTSAKKKQLAANKSNAKTRSSKRRHKVKRGDTLSHLARKYRTSIKAIKKANRMRNNNLILGRSIIIPDARS